MRTCATSRGEGGGSTADQNIKNCASIKKCKDRFPYIIRQLFVHRHAVTILNTTLSTPDNLANG